MGIKAELKKILEPSFYSLKNRLLSYILLNLTVIVAQFIYIKFRYPYLNSEIPLWFTRLWGESQLAPRTSIFIITYTSVGLFLAGLTMLVINKFYIRYFEETVTYSIFLANFFLSYSAYRIVQVGSSVYTPLFSPVLVGLVLPFVFAYVLAYLLMPIFIDMAQKRRIVTTPGVHTHPGMVLRKPSARGGGVLYALILIVVGLLFLGTKTDYMPLFVSVFMLGLLGFMDDIQNTLPSSKLKFLENPVWRLLLMFLAVLPFVMSGQKIEFVSIPFNGTLKFSDLTLNIGNVNFPVWTSLVTLIWIVWLLNVLSWSNGIDGQYGGIIGISSIIICILALRFTPLEPKHIQTATLAAISAGIALGFTKYTWFPSKIMWGFGAITAGMVISAMSVSVQSKIVTSFLVILIPIIDGFVTAVRRILQKKNPLSGDRGHLHHLLLEKGWSPSRIALFYWFTTALFGAIGLWSSERYSIQVALTLTGIVGFGITLLNLLSLRKKKEIQLFE
jgi:UDP-GlcNAc:undecaprenyl-phosphate GlcNAc-1-phosphate transferase